MNCHERRGSPGIRRRAAFAICANRTRARGSARSSDGARSGLIGERPTLIGVIVGFAAAALTAASSPLREATNRATDGSASPSSDAMRRSPDGPTPGR